MEESRKDYGWLVRGGNAAVKSPPPPPPPLDPLPSCVVSRAEGNAPASGVGVSAGFLPV